jgi:hypothetical protein
VVIVVGGSEFARQDSMAPQRLHAEIATGTTARYARAGSALAPLSFRQPAIRRHAGILAAMMRSTLMRPVSTNNSAQNTRL